jgi:NAD(P)H-flavin reductase
MARKIRCQVDAVTNHGDHVYTVLLKPVQKVPCFRPGQFLHLTLDEYDPSGFWPESRVFSIASAPQDRDQLVISYSVKGRYTNRMEQELTPGKFIWVKLPYGEFEVEGVGDVVLIAGGTGVTAFRAFISALKTDHPHRVWLLYGARRRELLLGKELIEHKRKEIPVFDVVYFVEQGADVGSAAYNPSPPVLSGVIRLDVLERYNFVSPPIYYLAGPPMMMKAMSNGLVQRGVPDANIRRDAWE